jgi:cephalosporin hydroxylase
MKLIIDTDKKTLTQEVDGEKQSIDLYSKKAFELLSDLWLKTGWSLKHIYTFTWLGRPIIQLPEDMFRMQEVIYHLRPDVIIETGIAHGGSLVYYASLCHAMGRGRVIGIDIDIRAHNRRSIENHEMFSYITLIEGGSTNTDTVNQVKDMVKKGEKTLVILDSDHSKQHVLAELEAYYDFVSPGSYIVATDGILRDLRDVPRGYDYWTKGNPTEAVNEFLKSHQEFILEKPHWLFNESPLTENITHWPDAWLKRKEG